MSIRSFIHIGGTLVLCLLGCGSWRVDPDGLTEADLALVSQMTLSGQPAHAGNEFALDLAVAGFGQQLFFDKGLSPGRPDGTAVSCADCHNPAEWFSDSRTGHNVSQGVGVTTRNSPSLVNVAFYETFGWDGRADTLWGQCHHAYQSPKTMKGSQPLLLAAVRTRYADRYQAIFGAPTTDDVIYANLLKAWAAYLTQLTSMHAPFDRYVQGEREALSVPQRRGLVLFLGKAGCIECHRGPMFTDNDYHSVGIGPDDEPGRFKGLQELAALAWRPPGALPPPAPTEADRGLIRTKGLRQVALTPPYFHAGQLETLKDVVWFYTQGGDHAGAGTTSPFLVPLGLSDDEQADLVSFLEALTGEAVKAELRCDNSRSALPPGVSVNDPTCPFGGVQVSGADAGVTRVCNGAPPTPACAEIP